MYHCHIHFYVFGCSQEISGLLKSMPPLEHFTHDFLENDMENADVIFASLSGSDASESIHTLISAKKQDAQLIVLADNAQFTALTDSLPFIHDIWTLPLTDEEVKFRFLKWQQAYKMQKDYWQTSQYLETTINSIPNMVWYKTKEGIHEKVNDSFCKTVNKSKSQVEGRGHAYIWDVEHDDPACIESELQVMRTEQTLISEETVQTNSGSRLLTTYKSPLYDVDGSVMGTVGVAIDITQEQEYKQQLLTKTKTLESLFTTMECGILCHTTDGARIISINQAALNILGYRTQDDLMSDGFNTIAQSVIDEDKPSLRQAIKSLQQEGDSVTVAYRVMHENGDILHVIGNIKLMQENGELFYQRFLLDCTKQRLREEKQQYEKQKRQNELIQALSVDYNLVCFFDLDTGNGTTLRINDCKYKVLDSIFDGELTMADNLKRYIDECVYSEDKELMRNSMTPEFFMEHLDGKMTTHINYRTTCCGELRYFQMKAVCTSDWTESHQVVLGFRSVDDETRIEMEKKKLLEDALLQANRANKAKSTFLSNMSHDIRTPMNAIIGFTTLAIKHINQQEKVAEYLKKIMTSGNHLLSLINDVLDMSRIESGKLHLSEQLCSLPDILHELCNIMQADIRNKQLDLHMDAIDIQHEEIYCDKLRLNQVLLNLLNNSIKYTAAGGSVSITLTEKSGAPAGFSNYEFIVKDTGIGMSEEFVSHIFEPFERERNSTISGIQGTGLGMAITKNIVEMMHGTIEVKSKKDFGTEFIACFTFRLGTEHKELPALPELKNCRALVVDDDFNTCDSVSCMLQQMGMRAEWTMSGKEAVLRTHQAVMRNDNYYIYIVDWLMPDMNGIEVVRRIRRETHDKAPIIVLTAYDWSDIEDEAREAGVTAFCSKPLFLSELNKCLRSIVKTDETSDEETNNTIAHFHNERILLVEDNELNQEIASELLHEAGFVTELASNGQAAIDMLTRAGAGYYSLILMDVQMPVMNGYDATKAIRKLDDPELASIPIIAMTANAFEEDKLEALRSGMNGHIAKPINIDDIIKELDKLLYLN